MRHTIMHFFFKVNTHFNNNKNLLCKYIYYHRSWNFKLTLTLTIKENKTPTLSVASVAT